MDQNHGLTPLEKTQFFDFFNFLFLYPRMALFRWRISSNTFSWPRLPKKRRWKNDQLWTKTSFSTFSPPCFYSIEMRFFPLEYHKTHYPGLYCPKNRQMEKWPILDQNDGLTPLENLNFLPVSTPCFYSLERRFFPLEYHKTHYPGLDCPKIRKMEKWPILYQNDGLTLSRNLNYLPV